MGMIPYQKIMSGVIKIGGAIQAFFKELLEKLKGIINKLENKLKVAIRGSTASIRKGMGGCQTTTVHYTRDPETNAWNEILVEYMQDEKKVPKEYRAQYERGQVIDITEDLKMSLG